MKKTYDELNSDNDVGYLGGVAMQHYCPIRKRHYFAAEVQSMAKYRMDVVVLASISSIHWRYLAMFLDPGLTDDKHDDFSAKETRNSS